MLKLKSIILLFFALNLFVIECSEHTENINRDAEIQEISRVIDSCIGWFRTKDFDLYFSSVAQDSDFVAVHPGDRVVRGFTEVLENSEVFKHPEFQYVRHEINDLTIKLSNSGKAAWFYCILDDINTWKGQPANWENTRWTGVLEKRNDRWVIVQQHFSFASE